MTDIVNSSPDSVVEPETSCVSTVSYEKSLAELNENPAIQDCLITLHSPSLPSTDSVAESSSPSNWKLELTLCQK